MWAQMSTNAVNTKKAPLPLSYYRACSFAGTLSCDWRNRHGAVRTYRQRKWLRTGCLATVMLTSVNRGEVF